MEGSENSLQGERKAQFKFHGTASEYFRIWIVNMALTIVTLGIYSAWAKVRKNRYFYSHTELDGGTFDYHAEPMAILIGRLIALAMFGIYGLTANYAPLVAIAVILVIFALAPFFVVRSRAFNMRNTSYRGIRFGFARSYGEAFKVYWGGALLTLFTLGIGAPYVQFMKNRFAANNSAFGQSRFAFDGVGDRFFVIYLTAFGLGILAVILAVIVAVAATALVGEDGVAGEIVAYVVTAAYLLMYAAVAVYVLVRVRNYVWNNLRLDRSSFESNLSVRHMLGLYITNMLAIIGTLGLAIPWAQVRLARYRAQCLQANLADDWESYLADQQQPGSAIGDEMADAFDLDVDIAF